jgi:hypothetical protein
VHCPLVRRYGGRTLLPSFLLLPSTRAKPSYHRRHTTPPALLPQIPRLSQPPLAVHLSLRLPFSPLHPHLDLPPLLLRPSNPSSQPSSLSQSEGTALGDTPTGSALISIAGELPHPKIRRRRKSKRDGTKTIRTTTTLPHLVGLGTDTTKKKKRRASRPATKGRTTAIQSRERRTTTTTTFKPIQRPLPPLRSPLESPLSVTAVDTTPPRRLLLPLPTTKTTKRPPLALSNTRTTLPTATTVVQPPRRKSVTSRASEEKGSTAITTTVVRKKTTTARRIGERKGIGRRRIRRQEQQSIRRGIWRSMGWCRARSRRKRSSHLLATSSFSQVSRTLVSTQ